MAHLTNKPVPVTDLTGRRDPGKGYIMDEYDVLQRDLENLGVFPFAPGMGSAMSELGDMILYSSTGRGGDTERVNNLDRFAGLPGTWIGKAAKEFGGLLSMTPEELIQLRRSINSLISDDPATREAVWEGVKEAGRNYQEDPMSVAEDLGPGVVTGPASTAIAGPRIMGKLLGGMKVKKLDAGADLYDVPAAGAFPPQPSGIPLSENPLASPPEAELTKLQQAVGPAAARESISEAVDPEDWTKAGHQEFLEADEVPPNWNPGEKSEGFVEGENVDLAMVKKSDLDKDGDDVDWEASDNDIDPTTLSDTELDQEILDTNMTINAIGKGTVDTDFDYQALLEKLVEERHRRRRGSGEGGSAGAKKASTPLEQMEGIDPSIPKEYGGPKGVTPKGGWIGKQAYNIENFSADSDLGDIAALLGQGQFSTKRNLWIFPTEPDVNVFDINGFINRMGNAGHKVNTDELSVLSDVLTEAAKLPSKRNLSSMAEDLYKMIAGSTKEQLRGQQRFLFDAGSLGFDL